MTSYHRPEPGTSARALAWVFLVAWLLLGVVAPLARAERWPAIRTEGQRLRYLLYLRRRLPNFFREGMRYDTDPLDILERQQEVLDEVERNSDYQALLRERPPLVTLRITARNEETAVRRSFDPAATDRWAQELTQRIASLPPGDFRKALDESIAHHARIVGENKLRAMATFMLHALPPPRKKDLMKVRLEDQLRAIRAEISPDARVQLGRSGTTLSAKEALAIIDSASALQDLALLHVVLQEGDFPATKEEAVKRLSLLSPDVLKNKEALTSRLNKIPALAPGQHHHSQVGNLVEAAGVTAKSLSTKQTEKVTRTKGELTLVEVPPHLALWRSCIGKDCATKRSFPYPTLPTEKVFYVTDDEGKSRGYVQATVVDTEHGKALYVHTINGPRISQRVATQIVQGLYQSRESLGVSQIALLPQKKILRRIRGWVDYEEVRKALLNLTKGKVTTALQYKDQPVRGLIDRFIKYKYDQARFHKEGVIYTPSPEDKLMPEVHVSQTAPEEISNSEKINPLEVLLLARDLADSRRTTMADRILKSAQIPKEQIERLRTLYPDAESVPAVAELPLTMARSLTGADPAHRSAAAELLSLYRPEEPEVLSTLAAHLEHADPAVRIAALSVLWSSRPKDPKIQARIVKSLADSHPVVRDLANSTLLRLRPPSSETLAAVRAHAGDSSPAVRRMASDLLGKLEVIAKKTRAVSCRLDQIP